MVGELALGGLPRFRVRVDDMGARRSARSPPLWMSMAAALRAATCGNSSGGGALGLAEAPQIRMPALLLLIGQSVVVSVAAPAATWRLLLQSLTGAKEKLLRRTDGRRGDSSFVKTEAPSIWQPERQCWLSIRAEAR